MIAKDAGSVAGWAARGLAGVLGVLSLGATSACMAYRYAPPGVLAADAMVGRTVRFIVAADSLTLRVERAEGRLVYGRVLAGRGLAAITLSDVRAARLEELTIDGHAQQLQLAKVRADPTTLTGGNVWFETKRGDIMLRGVRVLPDGWIEGRVVSNDPEAMTVESGARVKVRSTGVVRVNLDQVQSIDLRVVDAGRSIVNTLGMSVLLGTAMIVLFAGMFGQTGLSMSIIAP